MYNAIEVWIDDFIDHADDTQVSEKLQKWLGAQSCFHDYSHRNTFLTKLQCPEVTKIIGYNTWRNDFKQHVQEGEQAIWIQVPIITRRCPKCENSISYCENIGYEYNETSQDE